MFSFETESPDPDSPRKNEKAKKFWSFVKSLKHDAFGISTLRENGILKTDTLDKANICNRQFQSAFTRESDDEIPSKGTSPFTPMGEITVDSNGETQLVQFFHDMVSNLDRALNLNHRQTDVIIMDFAKANNRKKHHFYL